METYDSLRLCLARFACTGDSLRSLAFTFDERKFVRMKAQFFSRLATQTQVDANLFSVLLTVIRMGAQGCI